MAHSSFGPPWPNCDRSNIRTLVRADGLRIPVHHELLDLTAMLMDLTELGGYNIVPAWTWGYACRPIAGTDTPSNHSQGTADDINAPTNPRRRRGLPMVSDMPGWMINLWKAHGYRWGGNFSWPDPMHFEFMGTTADARAITARLRAFLSGNGAPAPRPPSAGRPTPVPFPGTVRMGDRGTAVRTWQTVLRQRGYSIAADGIFGPGTNHVVVDWQRKHGLVADGVAGPATWHSVLNA